MSMGCHIGGHANHLEKIRIPSVLSSYYPNNNSHRWQKDVKGKRNGDGKDGKRMNGGQKGWWSAPHLII